MIKWIKNEKLDGLDEKHRSVCLELLRAVVLTIGEVQIVHVKLHVDCVVLSSCSNQMSIVSRCWIWYRASATSEEMAKICGRRRIMLSCRKLPESLPKVIACRVSGSIFDSFTKMQYLVGLVTPWMAACEAMKNWYWNGWTIFLSITLPEELTRNF